MKGLNIHLGFILILFTAMAAAFCKRNNCIVEKSHSVADDGKRPLHYVPELSYKMLLLSAVAYDSILPQECLNNSLTSAKFHIQTVVTRNCDFLDNKCSGYVAVSHTVKAKVIAFRGSVGFDQILVEFLVTLLAPEETFLNGKVQTYWKRSFESLWQCMESKVKSLVSENPSYEIWVTGHSLGAAMASLASTWLAYYNIAPRKNIILYTFGMPRVGDYRYALQHDQLVKNSWRVVNSDDIVPHLPRLIESDISSGPYHHGVEVFYSEKAVSVNSAHRECHGRPVDEDKTCSRNQSFLNLRQSIARHKNYFSVYVGQFCKTSVNPSGRQEETLQVPKDRDSTYNYKNGFDFIGEHTSSRPPSSSTTASTPPGSFPIIYFLITICVLLLLAS